MRKFRILVALHLRQCLNWTSTGPRLGLNWTSGPQLQIPPPSIIYRSSFILAGWEAYVRYNSVKSNSFFSFLLPIPSKYGQLLEITCFVFTVSIGSCPPYGQLPVGASFMRAHTPVFLDREVAF